MSRPRAIRQTILGPSEPHNHTNGAGSCLVCQQHDLDAHRRARQNNTKTECPKCLKNLAAIEASSLPVVPKEKLEQAKEVADRILGERSNE